LFVGARNLVKSLVVPVKAPNGGGFRLSERLGPIQKIRFRGNCKVPKTSTDGSSILYFAEGAA
jgi:hypothetical protein